MGDMTEEQRATIREKLGARQSELVKMIKTGTTNASRDNKQRMGGEVGDPGDESIALQLADLNLAEVETELRELRAIERAFERLKEGSYGYCSECGCAIPYARLEAYPTAERCTACQTRHERVYGGRDITPSI